MDMTRTDGQTTKKDACAPFYASIGIIAEKQNHPS